MRWLGFPSFKAVAVASGLAISLAMASGVQAAGSFNAQTGTLTIPAVNVPGLGVYQAVLNYANPNATLGVGATLSVVQLTKASTPVDVPASYSPTDQSVSLPAIAVQGPDGRLNYFDIKLNGLNGNITSFVVTGMTDTTIGASVPGPAGPAGPTGATGPAGATGAAGPAGPAGASGGVSWVNVTSASAQAASNTGYIANNGSNGVVITLPTAPAIGDLVQVSGAGAWVLAPNGNQSIVQNMGGSGAVTGGGFSGSQGDSVVVQYVGSNTFLVISFVGHITSLGNTFFSQGGVLWTPPTFDGSHAFNWADGTAYCASASFGGLSGWRMPTTTELLGVDTYGVMGTHGWPSVAGNMWTSTTTGTPGVYGVEAFGYQVAAQQNGGNVLFVTCVR